MSTAPAIARCGRTCWPRCARRGGRTTRCSSRPTACSWATSRPTTSRRPRRPWSARTSTPAGRPRWRSSSSTAALTTRSSGSRRSSTLGDFAAIDLGASSGRVLAGRVDGGKVTLDELHRFANRPVQLPDGLHWDVLHLHAEALAGLRKAGGLDGVGVDTWGVDYGLLDGRGRLLRLPFHYRDGRTAGMVERAFERVPADELYAATGIQTLAINTVFQLVAEEDAPALAAAERIALLPDLLAYWLSGELANERTNASTTGLLDARSGEWALDLVERLGLPGRPFGALVEPGTQLGTVLPHHDFDAPVYTV